MPIVKMDRLTVVGLLEERHDVVQALMETGAVELIDQTSQACEHTEDRSEPDTDRSGPKEAGFLTQVEAAIQLANHLYPQPKKLFSSQRTVPAAELLKIARKEDQLIAWIEQLDANSNRLSELRVQLQRLETARALLEPWESLPLDLHERGTRQTRVFLGSLDFEQRTDQLVQQLQTEVPESFLQPVTEDENGIRCAVVTLHTRAEEVQTLLRQAGFNPLPETERTGTAAEQIRQIKQEQTAIRAEQDRLEEENAALAQNGPDFELLYDLLLIRKDRQQAVATLPSSRNTFWLTGWIPSEQVSRVKTRLNNRFLVALESRPAQQGEEHPILLQNKPFARAFETIVTMFSAPTVQEGDPTPVLAPFFFIFFGLMLGDVGYGFVLSAFCAVLIWKLKIKSQMVHMLFLCGLSSIVWGFLFGSFFGDMLPVLSQNQLIPKPLWFNPMENATKLMIWSMVFGVIHLFAGMAMNIHMLFQLGRGKDALLDIIPWYLILTGGGLMLGQFGGKTGLVLIVVGAAIIVLFGGREAKNPIMRFLKGLLALYDVTGYFSDILSYTRILALVLATSVIAMVVNLLGFLVGPTAFGFVVFAVIALGGHLLNLALSSLSAYVHTCRLHYVEFFGKFYEGGGQLWEPLRMKTQYVSLLSADDDR